MATTNPLQNEGHGHGKKAPVDLSFNPEERIGLTTEQAEKMIEKWGYNELPEITISAWYVLFLQFTGTMPYMMEIAVIIALAAQDWPDVGIILAMLFTNGFLGFHEQMKAAESLKALTSKMEQKIAVLRDGQASHMLTRCIVPGDVVLLLGGAAIPADIEWLEGDILSIDTAALTGEPLPRKYPSDEYGKLILCGSTVRAGEAYGIVRKTGIHTEIGSSNADIMKDKTQAKISVFEQKVLTAVQVIILIALIDVIVLFLVLGLADNQFRFSTNPYDDAHDTYIVHDALTCLSIIIASIPIALPIVLNVTMALGAGKMAREFDAVVTSLPALQDISSMTTLCSDKTGTLTTAHITIHAESVWTCGNFTKQDVALYGVLSSNRDKKEDAIDRSVVGHFDRVFGPQGINITSEYTRTRNVGFNPIYKRVLYEYSHPKHGKITIAKGLPNKVLDTSDGGVDDAADQWVCENAAALKDTVKKVDYDFSKAGYKTLGVVVRFGEGPWIYCGILPMLDPPRHDTAATVKNLIEAGIEVKMITGDHLNIAKETARLIGMGVNIHPGEATREATQDRNELVKAAHGFAQVLPKDKREVVLVLKNIYNEVVGMTGDGVNDAPALSAAQCGIAVDDATDAAKNAAAIILTTPGLSAIYSAVVESRRIFRKLKAYVTYRFAASIQIVVVLSVLAFASTCAIKSLAIILLALFNDITMLPIAYDVQQAGSKPENPRVDRILITAATLGLFGTFFALLFAYGGGPTGFFTGNGQFEVKPYCDSYTQGAIWLEMFLASELLIFSTRAPTYMLFSIMPSLALVVSVLLGCIVASLMATFSHVFGGLAPRDVAIIWAYVVAVTFFVDYIKVQLYKFFEENLEVLPDEPPNKAPAEAEGHHDHHESGAAMTNKAPAHIPEDETRGSIAADRLTEWALSKNERFSTLDPETRASYIQKAKENRKQPSDHNRASLSQGRLSLSSTGNSNTGGRVSGTGSGLAGGSVINTSGSLRPNVPGNRALKH